MQNSAWATVKAHWDPVPDWVLVLAEECDRTSQAATARALGFSPASVSLARKDDYLDRRRERERGGRGIRGGEMVE